MYTSVIFGPCYKQNSTICGCLEWQEAVLIDPSLNRTEAYLELLDEAGINLKRLEPAMGGWNVFLTGANCRE